jgi:hypothetical protein
MLRLSFHITYSSTVAANFSAVVPLKVSENETSLNTTTVEFPGLKFSAKYGY